MVSILIATYNSQNTLYDCLQSVLNQSLQDWECILIDGESRDKTLDIIREYKKEDPRFRYISEPDNGIYDALNKGIKLAKGEWIYVLGSDDKLTYDGLATLLENADSKSCAVYGNIIVEYLNTTKRIIVPKTINTIRYYMPMSHQGVIVKLCEIMALGGFDLRYVVKADYNMMQRLYLKGTVFQYVPVSVASCGMTGLSNKLTSNLKYDKERYLINMRNKANPIPLLAWMYAELRTIAIVLRDKLLRRK